MEPDMEYDDMDRYLDTMEPDTEFDDMVSYLDIHDYVYDEGDDEYGDFDD